MTALQHLPADASPADIDEAIKADGACIIDGLIDPEQLSALNGELAPYIDATELGRDDFVGKQTRRTGALAARSEICRDLIMHPSIIGACDLFLKPFCDRYQLHLTQTIAIGPGQGKQPLHRDRLAWGGYIPREIDPQLNTIWALTDFTKENGATQVIPGSNHWPDERKPEKDKVVQAEMKKGSVLIYSGSVIHSGGENNSDQTRIGLNITYCLGWLRQEENQYLSCPPHIARDFSPDLQALLGYSMGSYALGYFTPPVGPGEGPEAVPPEFLFNGKAGAWGDDLYAEVTERVVEKHKA